jgi:hypothetical protein
MQSPAPTSQHAINSSGYFKKCDVQLHSMGSGKRKSGKRIKRDPKLLGKRRQAPKRFAREIQVTFEEAIEMRDEWRRNPGKPEWLQNRIDLIAFEDGLRPREDSEDCNQEQTRNMRARRIATKLKNNEVPPRTQFLRKYQNLIHHGATLCNVDRAIAETSTLKEAFSIMLDSLAHWHGDGIVNFASLITPAYHLTKDTGGDILPTLDMIRERLQVVSL